MKNEESIKKGNLFLLQKIAKMINEDIGMFPSDSIFQQSTNPYYLKNKIIKAINTLDL